MHIPNAPTQLHKKPLTLANYRIWGFETLVSKSFSFQWLLCGKLKLQCADNKLFKDL